MLADTDGTENTSSNPHIQDIIKQAFASQTRRSFLKRGSAFFTAAAGATLAYRGPIPIKFNT